MLRLDLLRDLPPTVPAAAPATGPDTADGGAPGNAPERHGSPLLAVLVVLLGLLVLGAASLALMRPDFGGRFAGLWSRDGRAHADSLKRAAALRALRADASARIAASQSQTIEWLYYLEAVLPAPGDGTARLARASLAAPGRFLLRGEAASPEALSEIQEALVLVPGLDLVESVSGPAQGGVLPETFSFSGTIDFPADTTAPRGDRVVAAEILPARLARLTERAAAAGVALTAPAAGDVLAAGVLRLHAFRIGGTLQAADSAGFAPIREFLEAERHDRSPLGIRRITVENRAGRHLVFIDIMAFTP